MKYYIQVYELYTSKWDNDTMKRVKCEPYYKEALATDSVCPYDGRNGVSKALEAGKQYLKDMQGIHPSYKGFKVMINDTAVAKYLPTL